MKEIAIISKNVSAERDLETKLKTLGFEVFCSSKMLEALLLEEGRDYLTIFKDIIIDETVFDEELIVIMHNIRFKKDIVVYRVDSEKPSEQLLEKLPNKQQLIWLSSGISIKQLRETFCQESLSEMWSLDRTEKKQKYYKLLIKSLTPQEIKVFKCLYDARGEVVPRTAICEKIWNTDNMHSNLAQLSQLIHNIREKMERFNIDSRYLKTQWRDGYSLAEEIILMLDHFYINKENQKIVATV